MQEVGVQSLPEQRRGEHGTGRRVRGNQRTAVAGSGVACRADVDFKHNYANCVHSIADIRRFNTVDDTVEIVTIGKTVS